MDRRRFLAALAAGAATLAARAPAKFRTAPRRVLVLGGTNFLGPATVRAILMNGHEVTLFNRGVTNPQLFPYLEKLRGFRSPDADDQNLSQLQGRRWDVVVDVWPSDPATVASAATLLKDRTAHYLYVSSIAAYAGADFARPGVTEDAPLLPWMEASRSYNRGKAESERRLHAIVGDRLTIVRPGPIKGDRDTTPDLYAWLKRAQAGGTHIGPGSGDDHVQLVDVKDVARFLALAIERSLYGTFNLTGRPLTFREFLDDCRAAVGSSARFVWIPQQFLHGYGLDPDPGYLGKFSFWHPEPERVGFFQVSSAKAFSAGWQQRPFRETAIEYLEWIDGLDPLVFDWRDELSPAVEARVLKAWSEQHP